MSMVTIQPGDLGADFTVLTPAIQRWILEHGVKYVFRYVVEPSSTRINKDLKAWELDWYGKHGIACIPNFEHEAEVADDGRPGGLKDGKEFARLCDAFGFPKDVIGIVSVDQDVHAGNLQGAIAYVDGFVEGTGKRPFGIYGDDDIAVQFTKNNKLYWRAAALGWSRGEPNPLVHVQQKLPINDDGAVLDPNRCVTAFQAWVPGTVDAPAPAPEPPEEPDMPKPVFFTIEGNSIPLYVSTDGITAHHVSAIQYGALGGPTPIVMSKVDARKYAFAATVPPEQLGLS